VAKILIVEDERAIANAVAMGLRDELHVVDVAADGESGWLAAQSGEHELIVLDIMLPVVDGLTVCRRIRKRRSDVPILMLTARDTDDDVVKGLDAGADDYLVKPFSFEVLLARVRALLRRAAGRASPRLEAGRVSLDVVAHRAFLDGSEVALTAKELMLLEALLRRPGAVVSKARLMELVWESEAEVESNVVEVHVAALRRKLDAKLIHTVRGLGYSIRDDDTVPPR
jgi:two-component system OmpR family response regulator